MTDAPRQSGDYWSLSRGPWASLWFILPFLAVYEANAWRAAGPDGGRNGADIWIRQAVVDSGLHAEWLFPFLAPLILIGWHVGERGLFRKAEPHPGSASPWIVHYETLTGMFAECVLYAMFLVLLGQVSHALFDAQTSPLLAAVPMHRTISFLGAGIYEELLFRLMLLPVLYGAARLLLMPRRTAALCAILGSSLLFATAHYVETTAFLSPTEILAAIRRVQMSPELWYGFTFRFLAGIVFAILFCIRGFGITAGCHMFYDVTVGVLLGNVHA
jgi:membrane protease YdiL (CAAX protease family)